jgi:serine O-acetyltransferase
MFVSRLVYHRRTPIVGIVVKELLALYGVEFPRNVEVGKGLKMMHRAFGTVIHPGTTIGNNVTIFHGVTVGKSDPWGPSKIQRIYLEDDVVLCPGVKVLCSGESLRIGAGSIIGANAVLTQSTGPREIWAGVPARRIRSRDEM